MLDQALQIVHVQMSKDHPDDAFYLKLLHCNKGCLLHTLRGMLTAGYVVACSMKTESVSICSIRDQELVSQ